MPKYQKLMTEILDQIFEGYTYDSGKLKVVNEQAAKKAAGSLHKLVLEKSRDLWDQLEAAEGSLADVAEEISFEELNSNPSSVDMSAGGSVAKDTTPEEGQADAMAEPTLEGILGSADEMDFDSIFEMGMGMDPSMNRRSEPNMMDEYGDDKEEVVDGDEDYSDLEMGMDDADMGSDMEDGMQGDQFGDQQQDDDMMGGQQGDQYGDQQQDDDMMGGQQGDQYGDQQMDDLEMGGQQDGDMEGGFDFDLDLDGMDSEEDEMDEMMGKPYRMEGKGDKELPWEKKDKDDDDDDDDKDDDDKDDDDKDDKDDD